MHTYLARDYTCTGYCNVPLFAYSQPVANGKPTTNCQSAMQKELESTFGLAAVICIITCGAAAVTFPTQYWLWKTYGDQITDLYNKVSTGNLDTLVSIVSINNLFSEGQSSAKDKSEEKKDSVGNNLLSDGLNAGADEENKEDTAGADKFVKT